MSRTGDAMIDKMNEDYERELDVIYQMGYAAYSEGAKYSTCPYKVVPLKAAWEDGFMDASMADEPLEEWNDWLDEESEGEVEFFDHMNEEDWID